MDGMREWRIRNGPMLMVVACGIGVGLCCLGLALSGHWAIVRALVGVKVGMVGLWTGVLAASAGGALVAVGAWCSPQAQTQEPTKGEW
jgi:hypothetical protein